MTKTTKRLRLPGRFYLFPYSSATIPAYTIIEIVIAMMITAILIGVAFSAYSIVHKSYVSFQRQNERLARLSQLDFLLQRDFIHAQSVFCKDSTLCFRNETDTVFYHFGPERIIREKQLQDTFIINTAGFTPVMTDSSNDAAGKNLLIDHLTLRIVIDKEIIPYYYRKHYSFTELFKTTKDARD